jgi:hypothetical protein
VKKYLLGSVLVGTLVYAMIPAQAATQYRVDSSQGILHADLYATITVGLDSPTVAFVDIQSSSYVFQDIFSNLNLAPGSVVSDATGFNLEGQSLEFVAHSHPVQVDDGIVDYGFFNSSQLIAGVVGGGSDTRAIEADFTVTNPAGWGSDADVFLANANGYIMAFDVETAINPLEPFTVASFCPTCNGGTTSTSVPEPSTIAVLGLGILGLIGVRQHKAKPFPPVEH